jgi:hypothetical protein
MAPHGQRSVDGGRSAAVRLALAGHGAGAAGGELTGHSALYPVSVDGFAIPLAKSSFVPNQERAARNRIGQGSGFAICTNTCLLFWRSPSVRI